VPLTVVRPHPDPAAPGPDSADDFDDLTEEASLLRAAIRRLAADGLTDADLKESAELRHLIQTLCTVLRTAHTIVDRNHPLLDELDNVIQEIGRKELERRAAEEGWSADG
jgi:hypothetical protein